MSGIWYATAILLGRIFAIAATTGALFSIASEVGPLAPSPAEEQPTTNLSAEQGASEPGISEPGISEPGDSEQAATSSPGSDSMAARATHPDYTKAMELANQAVVAYQAAKQTSEPSTKISFTQRERVLWQAALQKLSHVPASSASYGQATAKRSQYQTLLATAESKLAEHDNAFLSTIVSSAGVPSEQVHITLCQLDSGSDPTYANHCRHHQGDSLLASPASLIKLPIAIALMDKVEQENRSLNDEIYIEPSNFTENAEGASIEINQEYTLGQVMVRMIKESNNIATNQLIDYIGRDAIADTMAKRGYTDTLVDFKLAGDRILPPNPGTQSNQITSNDLTAMMVAIYGLENPGDEALLTALISQKDRELGHTALKDLGSTTTWLGEKTGQNDRLIGSTLAMKVGTQRYALTVAIDHSGDLYGLQAIIKGIAEHLIETGPIVGTGEHSH